MLSTKVIWAKSFRSFFVKKQDIHMVYENWQDTMSLQMQITKYQILS